MSWKGTLYVLDSSAFHAEFRDHAQLKDAVKDHVESICRHIEIHNADDLVSRCQSSVPMWSKLQSVAERGLHLTHSPAALKTYAKEFNVDVTWREDALVFDGSLESQWAILKLLDEDRTEGPVSRRHFESSAKREV